MTKSTVNKLFAGSLIAIAGGTVLSLVAAIVAYTNSALIMNGPDVVGVEPTAFAWSMVGVAIVGGLVMVTGAIGQFVAWIGAVLNTSRLEDKTWFIVLLVLGLFSFGFIAMLVYVLAGPDGTAAQPAIQTRAALPTT
jgi:hypothetical protein